MPPDSSLTRASALLSRRAQFEQRRHHCAALRAAQAKVAAEDQQVLADGEVQVEVIELRHRRRRVPALRARGLESARRTDGSRRRPARRCRAACAAWSSCPRRLVRAGKTFAGVDVKRQSVDYLLFRRSFFNLIELDGGIGHE